MENKTQQQPTTHQFHPFSLNPSRISNTDEESAAAIPTNSVDNRRRILLARLCGLSVALLLLLAVIAVILAFTVFQVYDPTVTMNAVYFHDIRIAGDGLNVTAVADISVRNPNSGTLRFGESVTEFCIGDKVVGSGRAAELRVGAKETLRMNVSAAMVSDRGASVADSRGERIVRAKSRTVVEGKVRVMGVFKRDVGVKMACNLSFESSWPAKVAGKKDCVSNVK